MRISKTEGVVWASALIIMCVVSIVVGSETNRIQGEAQIRLFFELEESTGVQDFCKGKVDMPISFTLSSQNDFVSMVNYLNLSTIYYTESPVLTDVSFYAVKLEGQCMHSASISYCWTTRFNMWTGVYE